MSTKRINVWSSPRNVSTAFMYAFAQRKDITVVDEPLYAHYLSNTTSKAVHPVTAEILDLMENDGQKIVDEVIFGEYDTSIALFKQMTHHLIELDLDFTTRTENILLIRDPKRIIASYVKVIQNPTIADIGIKMQYDLFQRLKKANKVAAVVDAKKLLLNPPKVLAQLCQQLAIPFDTNMLSWEAGPIKEDGIWAKDWYANVHQSTGFIPYVEKAVHLEGALAELAEECQFYYDYLLEYAI
ncbi:MAG: hypothetical protein AB8G86_01665 [Saprospiraceae bacterium]